MSATTVQSEQHRHAQQATTTSPVRALQSCLYDGFVSHRRERPVLHRFRNRLYLQYIDLEEVEQVFRVPFLWSTRALSIVRFRRADYHGDPNRPLAECVRETVHRKLGIRLSGPIRLLTHVRYFGFVFNPVSFYYCFDETDSRMVAMLAEVTNTPWGDRHSYVIPFSDDGTVHQFEHSKEFHVSPFMTMDMLYRWTLNTPGDSVAVRIEADNNEGRLFDATLSLSRRALSVRNRFSSMLRFPFMTAAVIIAIYWQAFLLWCRNVPFVPHPQRAGLAPRD